MSPNEVLMDKIAFYFQGKDNFLEGLIEKSMFEEDSVRKLYQTTRKTRILFNLCLITLLMGNRVSEEQLLGGQLSYCLTSIFEEYQTTNTDSTFIAAARVFYELCKDEIFVQDFLQKPNGVQSLKILLKHAEELPFDDTELLNIIFRAFYRMIKSDKKNLKLFSQLEIGLISKIIDILYAHMSNPGKIDSVMHGVSILSHYFT